MSDTELEDSVFESASLSQILDDLSSSTELLVRLATKIADENIDVILAGKNNVEVSMGKLLRALLEYASTDDQPNGRTGLRYTAGVIYTAHNETRLQSTAEYFLNYMLYPMQAYRKIPTPPEPSEEDLTPGLGDVAQEIESAKRTPSFRKELLIREDYRCAVHRNEVDAKFKCLASSKDDPDWKLQGCHIVPFCLNSSSSEKKVKPAAVTWCLIKDWTSCDIKSLIGSGINDITNGILLCPNAHAAFRDFNWYLDPPDISHFYKLCRAYSGECLQLVKFESRKDRQVPSPKLLAIHAAFARVLHASGAMEYFNELQDDLDEARVLAQDGSDYNVLFYALQSLAVRS